MRTLEHSVEQNEVSEFEKCVYKNTNAHSIHPLIRIRIQFPVIDCIIFSISNRIGDSVKKQKYEC
jgi:hypothetical protein